MFQMVTVKESTFQYLKGSTVNMNLEDDIIHSILVLARPLLSMGEKRPQLPMRRKETGLNFS